MNPGVVYIIAALLFGAILPFIKNVFHEWWQVGAVAAVYFSLTRLIMFLVERKMRGKAARTR